MPEPLNHIWRKLHRSQEHILQVQKSVDSIMGSIPNRVVSKNDVDAVQRLRDTMALIITDPSDRRRRSHPSPGADHFAAQLAGPS
jgi:hypothetical protein